MNKTYIQTTWRSAGERFLKRISFAVFRSAVLSIKSRLTITTQAVGRDRSQGEKNITKDDLSPVEMTSALCDKLHTNI